MHWPSRNAPSYPRLFLRSIYEIPMANDKFSKKMPDLVGMEEMSRAKDSYLTCDKTSFQKPIHLSYCQREHPDFLYIHED